MKVLERLSQQFEQDREQAIKEFDTTRKNTDITLKGLQDSFIRLAFVFDSMLNMITNLKQMVDKQQVEIEQLRALTKAEDIDTIQLHNNTKAV